MSLHATFIFLILNGFISRANAAAIPHTEVKTVNNSTNSTEAGNSTTLLQLPAADKPSKSLLLENLDIEDQTKLTCTWFNVRDAGEYLVRYGYEDSMEWKMHKPEMAEKLLTRGLVKFQSRMKLPLTGKLDNATRYEMCEPRCDFPDILTPFSTRMKRYNLGNSAWDQSDFPLTVGFKKYSNKMGRRAQEDAFMKAAQQWESVSGLSFTRGNPKSSKITIDFDYHDGAWGVLGKAWFPKIGTIIFENGESWEADIPRNGESPNISYYGLSFYSVAMHELGHALGISHSDVKNAIMNAKYQRGVINLQSDDIRAVQKLYGQGTRTTSNRRTNLFGGRSNRRQGSRLNGSRRRGLRSRRIF